MVTTNDLDSLELDRIDYQILHSLLIDARVPLRRIGVVVGVSEQTVARRFSRLSRAGAVNIVGVARDTRRVRPWMVRMRCRLGSAQTVAEALARRSDVAWVNLMAGGTEISCRVNASTAGDDMLLERIPRTKEVIDLSAHAVLHRFDADAPDWDPFPEPLTPAQREALRPWGEPLEPVGITDDDGALLAALAADGRARISDLARATGWSPGRVTRRIETLRRSGELELEVDILADLFGFRGAAMLWMTVHPGQVDAVGRAMVAMPEFPFVAATSGRENLAASVLTTDYEQLYHLVGERVGVLDGVGQVEISPTLRRFKQEGTRVSGSRLRR